MVVGHFPAAKLGYLAARHLSKFVANFIKNRAKNSPLFRKYICVPPAQCYNWLEVKTKMWAMHVGRGSALEVRPLTEAAAIDLGANLLGEFILFSTAALLLVLELARQSRKETRNRLSRQGDKDELLAAIDEVDQYLKKQEILIKEITAALAELRKPIKM